MTDTESNYGESAINKSMTDIRNTLKKLIAVHNQAVIEDWEAMRKDADRKPHYTDEQIIVKLLALINQSNREYCNGIIGEDDEEYMYDGGIPRANNELRYQLRKKNIG
jgi:hypothetical protein